MGLTGTKVGDWLKANAPQLLDTVENFVPAPVKGGMDVIRGLVGLDTTIPPEKKEEFNQLAAQHESDMLKMQNDFQIQQQQSELSDTANARSREIEITKTTGKRDIQLMILAYWGVIAPVAIVGYLMIYGMSKMDTSVAMLVGGLIGMIVGEYKTIYNYFLGSSSGSKAKDEQISNMLKN